MTNLFDRYFLVLAGRVNAAECGVVASVSSVRNDSFTYGWPLDLPGTEETVAVGSGDPATRSRFERSQK